MTPVSTQCLAMTDRKTDGRPYREIYINHSQDARQLEIEKKHASVRIIRKSYNSPKFG